MSHKFLYPPDISDLEIQNVLLHRFGVSAPAATAGTEAKIGYLGSTAGGTGNPVWCDGTVYHKIERTYTGPGQPTGWGKVINETLTVPLFIGDLQGLADEAVRLDAPISISIAGKVTAPAVSIQNSGDAVALNVSALSVDPSDINLTSGYLIQGNGSNKGAEVFPSSIRLDQWGAPNIDLTFNSKRLINVADPVNDQDAATKHWVLGVVSGFVPKTPVRLATVAALPSYTSNGLAVTVLTASANGALTVDGASVAANDRVLVKDETAGSQKNNGVYTVTATGSAGTPWVLTRAADADNDAEVTTGDEYFVSAGATLAASRWALQTAEPITLGTTGLLFVQTGGNTAYVAGNGLVQVGNTFHFAQSSNYTAGAVAVAASSSAMGFVGPGTTYQVFRVASNGVLGFGAIDLAAYPHSITGILGSGNGGTGNSTVNAGDLLYGSGGTWARLAATATGNVLLSGTAPSWGKIALSTHISGILPVANGGTGTSAFTTNAVLYGGSPSTLAFAGGSNAQFLQINGAGVPAFNTMSGDIWVAGDGTTTIANRAVLYAKIQDVPTGVVAGRIDPGSGPLTSLTFATLAAALGPLLTTTITLTGTVTGSGAGTVATVVPLAGYSVLGVAAASGPNAAAITAGTSGHVLRRFGTTLGFGSIDLSDANSTINALPVNRGGTGRTVALVFPNVAGLIPRQRKIDLAAGSSNYSGILHGFTNRHLTATLVGSDGGVVSAKIDITATTVSVSFGRNTDKVYTLILTGSDQVDPM